MYLDDTTLQGLAKRLDIQAEFPELAGLQSLPRSCCGSNGRKELSRRLDQAKCAISRLSAERRTRLKQLLRVETLSVVCPAAPDTIIKF